MKTEKGGAEKVGGYTYDTVSRKWAYMCKMYGKVAAQNIEEFTDVIRNQTRSIWMCFHQKFHNMEY